MPLRRIENPYVPSRLIWFIHNLSIPVPSHSAIACFAPRNIQSLAGVVAVGVPIHPSTGRIPDRICAGLAVNVFCRRARKQSIDCRRNVLWRRDGGWRSFSPARQKVFRLGRQRDMAIQPTPPLARPHSQVPTGCIGQPLVFRRRKSRRDAAP